MSLTVHLYCLSLDPKLWGPAWLEGSASPIHFISLCPGGLWETPSSLKQEGLCLTPTEGRLLYYPCNQHRPLLYHEARAAEKTGK